MTPSLQEEEPPLPQIDYFVIENSKGGTEIVQQVTSEETYPCGWVVSQLLVPRFRPDHASSVTRVEYSLVLSTVLGRKISTTLSSSNLPPFGLLLEPPTPLIRGPLVVYTVTARAFGTVNVTTPVSTTATIQFRAAGCLAFSVFDTWQTRQFPMRHLIY